MISDFVQGGEGASVSQYEDIRHITPHAFSLAELVCICFSYKPMIYSVSVSNCMDDIMISIVYCGHVCCVVFVVCDDSFIAVMM